MNWELVRIKNPKNKIKVKILLKINKLISMVRPQAKSDPE